MKKEKYLAILGKVEELEMALNGNGGGNPNHDDLGRFTTGPGGKVEKTSGKGEFTLSKDAQKVFDEIDDWTDGAYKKDLKKIYDEFSELGVDVDKIKFETNIDKLPGSMGDYVKVHKNLGGCATTKKNLEAVIWLNRDDQEDYIPMSGRKKYLEGKDVKDQPHGVDSTALGIIRHELGHIVAATVYMNSRNRKGTGGSLNMGAVRVDANQRFKKIFGNNYDFNKLKMSRYGLTNHGEAIAESFSNPDFSEDTRKIYDYYKKELSKIKSKNAIEKDSEWIILCDGYPKDEK